MWRASLHHLTYRSHCYGLGGLPARIIRRRVDPEVEQALTRIAWWNWSHEQIKDTLADFRKLDAS